jgi:hypothetical protein
MTYRFLQTVVTFTLAAAIGTPQSVAPNRDSGLMIRSITWTPVSTSQAGLPDPGTKIQVALAGVPLTVESKLSGPALLTAIDKAERSIQAVYKALGSSVRVEHEVAQIPSRALEVRFRVIELCACDR